jgi:heptosyltransferase-2
MVSFYSALSGESGLPDEAPSLVLDAALSAQTWRKFHLEPQTYFVFAPGAEYGPAKRWPVSHFASLARSLLLPIVLLGSGKDSAICEEILQQTGAEIGSPIPSGLGLNLSGKTSLIEAFAIIAGAKAVISNDSGLMHVAAALGVRQVALFGSSSPLHTPPRNTLAEVIWLKNDPTYQPALNCAPCFERLCPLGHTRCLVDIQPELVRTRLTALLE